MALVEKYEIGELEIQIHAHSSDSAQHPSVRIEVPEGFKVLGGGASVDYLGSGNLLTSIFPDGERVWVASSKDHKTPCFAKVQGFCIAGRMKNGSQIPSDDYVIRSKDSVPAHHPFTEVVLPAGWFVVGGGARANWTGAGSLLYASYPGGRNSWIASAKDHMTPDKATITAFAIGVKESFLDRVGLKIIQKDTTSGTPTAHPSVSCVLEHGYRLVCGGAKTNWTGAGNLLTESFPQDQHMWKARGKDHKRSDPSTITAWCVGIGPE